MKQLSVGSPGQAHRPSGPALARVPIDLCRLLIPPMGICCRANEREKPTLESATRTKLDGRLKRIAGQVAGIQRMIEEDRYCVDVLLQIAAVRAALDQAGKLLLGAHVETCVRSAIESGARRERKAKIDELLEVFARFGSLSTR